jgi:hypothetical protein
MQSSRLHTAALRFKCKRLSEQTAIRTYLMRQAKLEDAPE